MITPEFVIALLEEAGATLVALPASGCRPAQYKSNWPGYVQEFMDAYGYTQEEMRPPRPSSMAIDHMMEVFTIIQDAIPLTEPPKHSQHKWSYHGGAVLRRIVHMRAITCPFTGKNKINWKRMGDAFKTDPRTIQNWHKQGIDYVVRHISANPQKFSNNLQKRLALVAADDVVIGI